MMILSHLKRPKKKNNSVTEPSAQVLFGSKSLQYQDNNTTHSPVQKLLPSVNEYLYFQIYEEIAQ